MINDIKDTPEDYIRGLSLADITVVNFDDWGEGRKFADVIFDANVLPRNNVQGKTEFYMGPDYMALDPAFEEYHTRAKTSARRAEKLMIMMGGADPLRLTDRVFQALRPKLKDFEITLVIGFGNQRFAAEAEAAAMDNVRLLKGSSSLAQHMYEADLALISGGITMFEMAAVGTPAIVLCQAEHEVVNARLLEDRALAAKVGAQCMCRSATRSAGSRYSCRGNGCSHWTGGSKTRCASL